jgi:excisionase family DNA binding protein
MSSPQYPADPNNNDTETASTTADPPSGVRAKVSTDDQQLYQLHTLKEAAKRLSISLRTFRKYVDRGLVKTVRIGARHVRVAEQEIRRLVQSGLPE